MQFGLLEKILRVVEHCKDLSLAALYRLCLVVHLVFHIELSLFSHFEANAKSAGICNKKIETKTQIEYDVARFTIPL